MIQKCLVIVLIAGLHLAGKSVREQLGLTQGVLTALRWRDTGKKACNWIKTVFLERTESTAIGSRNGREFRADYRPVFLVADDETLRKSFSFRFDDVAMPGYSTRAKEKGPTSIDSKLGEYKKQNK